jgi:phosphomannomutase
VIAENGRLIVSHSGLRGRPGAGLDGAVVGELAGGLLSLLSERDLPATIAVARDARPSGESLAAQVIEAATRRGADVVDLGTVSTPTAKLAARRRGLGGAVVVTGSHLGPDWNGLKLVAAPDYWPLDPRLLPPAAPTTGGPAGRVSNDHEAAREHAAAVCESVDADAIRRAALRVSLRGGCGQAARLALSRLGCTLVRNGADIGLVMDGDGDRLQLIDERSSPIDAEATFPLAAISLGARRLVKGADTSRIVDLMAERRGWTVRVSPPGELHLLEELTDADAGIAGEGNGGVVIPGVGMARDALATGAIILALIAADGAPLSELAGELPSLARRRANLPCAGAAAAADALTTLAERVGSPVGDPVGGITLERPGGAWALIRQSATEPVLRVTVESPEPSLTEEVFAEIETALSSA